MATTQNRKKLISLIMGLLLLSGLTTGCSRNSSTTAAEVTAAAVSSLSVDFDGEDLNSSWDASQATQITLASDKITVKGSGAVASGSTVTIQSGGVYVVTGSLSNGQILVNSSDKNTVKLVLNGVNLTNLSTSPVYVQNAEKTIITLAANTINTISDGSAYSQTDAADEPNAAIFSHDDLTINGSGSLAVNGNYKHGIVCNDDLKIVSGTITVKSAADGIKGKDSVAVRDGNITITSGGDGIQSSNDTDTAKGWVYIANGNIQITAALDGIQAETCVDIENGNITVNTGGGSQNSISHTQTAPGANRTQVSTTATDTESTKGIKSGSNIIFAGGNIVTNTADDAVHANGSIAFNGGTLTLDSGDDGIHADTSLLFNGGDITINKSYEGIESAAITINNGKFHITSSDDGINTSGGSDGSSINGRPGQNNFDASDGSKLNIAGGYIYVNAQGDGIDVNGEWTMTGGQVIVNGPTNDGNGALDCNGTFAMNGGFLVAAGSAGMAEAPDDSSTQASLKLNLGIQPAGTIVRIVNAKGEAILTFTPIKDYASVVVSSPLLSKGETYTIYTGGSCSGTSEDDLYDGGTYTGGTQVSSIQLTSTVTSYGQSESARQGGPRSGMGPNPGTRP